MAESKQKCTSTPLGMIPRGPARRRRMGVFTFVVAGWTCEPRLSAGDGAWPACGAAQHKLEGNVQTAKAPTHSSLKTITDCPESTD